MIGYFILGESLSSEHARAVMEGSLLAPAHIAERGEVKKSTGQEQGKDAKGIASKRTSLVIPKSLIAGLSNSYNR